MPAPCSLPAAYHAAPLRPRASRLLEPTLHRVHARVQRLVAGDVGGIEDAGIATRRVVRDPMALHRGQAACQPGARYLATGELGGLPGEGPHDLSQRVTGHVESSARRWWRRRGRRRCSLGRSGTRRRGSGRGLRDRAGRRLRPRLRRSGSRWRPPEFGFEHGQLRADGGHLPTNGGFDRRPLAGDRGPFGDWQHRLVPPVGPAPPAAISSTNNVTHSPFRRFPRRRGRGTGCNNSSDASGSPACSRSSNSSGHMGAAAPPSSIATGSTASASASGSGSGGRGGAARGGGVGRRGGGGGLGGGGGGMSSAAVRNMGSCRSSARLAGGAGGGGGGRGGGGGGGGGGGFAAAGVNFGSDGGFAAGVRRVAAADGVTGL